MLNSLHHYFVPALSPAMFNIATIVVRVRPRAGDAARSGCRPSWRSRSPRSSADSGRSRSSGRRSGAKASAIGRVLDLRDPGSAAGADPDGAGHDRARRDAGESVRQHAARDKPGHRRGVVADVRVPADVPADRAVRRVDRHGGAAGRVAPRGGRRHGRHPRHRCRAGWADADAERAGDDRSLSSSPRRSCGCCSSAAGSCRRTPRRRRRRLQLLRDRPRRLFGGAHRVAGLLCASDDSRVPVAGQRRRRSPSTCWRASCWSGRWDFGVWRSARRSRRIANGAALVWMLRRRLGGIDGRRLSVTLGQGHGVIGRDGHRGRRDSARDGSRRAGFRAHGRSSLRLGASIGGGIAALAATAQILRVDEFGDAADMIRGRVRKLLPK